MEMINCLLIYGSLITSTMGFMDIEVFFPNIKGNLTEVIWAHAVNNASYLNDTFAKNEIMMIEADVQLGTLSGQPDKIIPIMSHTNNISDLSLEMFFKKVNDHNKQNQKNTTKKGIKLDFKKIEAFVMSTDIIRSYSGQANYPLWLNADIISGPISATNLPVNASQFLEGAKAFADAWVSVGWTTFYGNGMTGEYSDRNIEEMIESLKIHNLTNRITFPVRAGLAAESQQQMNNLLEKCKNSTLTIWSSEGDNVNIVNLRQLIANIGIDKIFIDVPSDLKSQLKLNDLPKPNSAVKTFVTSFSVMLTLLLIVL